MSRPRPCGLLGGGACHGAGCPAPESATSTRSVPRATWMRTWNSVRAYWIAFIASSDTITEMASRRSARTSPTAPRTKRRAARDDPGSGGKVRAAFTA